MKKMTLILLFYFSTHREQQFGPPHSVSMIDSGIDGNRNTFRTKDLIHTPLSRRLAILESKDFVFVLANLYIIALPNGKPLADRPTSCQYS